MKRKPKFKINKKLVELTFEGGPRDGQVKEYPSFCGGVRIGDRDALQYHYYQKQGDKLVYQGLFDKTPRIK
ncbi:hypothetical protein [Vibrio phage vB_VhaS-tm]|nr:hypothetical protein [Vibrio phage vB_VhaS-tm]